MRPTKKVKANSLLWLTLSAALAFTLDRFSKLWALSALAHHESVKFLPPLLNFYLTGNTGAAFSLGKNNGPFVLALATGTTILLLVWAGLRACTKKTGALESIGAGILIGASLGNLFDRYTRGQVTDFLEFGFMRFPIFNVADILIDVGIVLIVWQILSAKPREEKNAD